MEKKQLINLYENEIGLREGYESIEDMILWEYSYYEAESWEGWTTKDIAWKILDGIKPNTIEKVIDSINDEFDGEDGEDYAEITVFERAQKFWNIS